jgi:drug/metabolite transporter (DMT)-like permease
VWAFAAGTCGIAGLGAFYYALSRGTMGVVAPLTAVIGAGLPVVIGLIEGEQLELVRGVGIVVALAAVVLISLPGSASTTDERRLRRVDLSQLPLIVAGGVGFGLFFVFLSRATDTGSTWWPLVVVRLAGVVFIAGSVVVALARTNAPRLAIRADIVLGLPKVRARALPIPLLAGLFLLTGVGDLGGNAFFVLASRADVLSVAVVLSSLYPVVTTLLAAVFLHERLRPVQIAGVLLASLSVPLLR